MKVCTDLETWLMDFGDEVIRFLDEDNDICYGIIEEAIDLGQGKWLIGIREIVDGELWDGIDYYPLETLHFSKYEEDQEIFLDEEDNDNEEEEGPLFLKDSIFD